MRSRRGSAIGGRNISKQIASAENNLCVILAKDQATVNGADGALHARNNTMPTDCFIGLGSNLGETERTINLALNEINALPDTRVLDTSPLFRTLPVGPQDQPDFLNAVAAIQTALPAEQLLQKLQSIETSAGRTPTRHWGERVLDLDILSYGNENIHLPHLTVPHQHLADRAFVLVPWHAIAADFTLPDGRTIETLYRRCDKSGIWYHGEAHWRNDT